MSGSDPSTDPPLDSGAYIGRLPELEAESMPADTGRIQEQEVAERLEAHRVGRVPGDARLRGSGGARGLGDEPGASGASDDSSSKAPDDWS